MGPGTDTAAAIVAVFAVLVALGVWKFVELAIWAFHQVLSW
jgi:hypothetical protein